MEIKWSGIIAMFLLMVLALTEHQAISATGAPHGGTLKPATHEGPHTHPLGKASNLVFELVQKKDLFIIYPFVSSGKNGPLQPISPRRGFSEIRVTLIGKARRQIVAAIVQTTTEAIKARINPISEEALNLEEGDPLVVKVAVIHNRIPKTAEFAVEKESIIGMIPRKRAVSQDDAYHSGVVPAIKPTAGVTKAERQAYAKEVEAKVEEWRSRVQKLKQDEKAAPAERRAELRSRRRYLEEKLEGVQAHVHLLRDSRNVTWKATQQMLETELRAMRTRYGTAE